MQTDNWELGTKFQDRAPLKSDIIDREVYRLENDNFSFIVGTAVRDTLLVATYQDVTGTGGTGYALRIQGEKARVFLGFISDQPVLIAFYETSDGGYSLSVTEFGLHMDEQIVRKYYGLNDWAAGIDNAKEMFENYQRWIPNLQELDVTRSEWGWNIKAKLDVKAYRKWYELTPLKGIWLSPPDIVNVVRRDEDSTTIRWDDFFAEVPNSLVTLLEEPPVEDTSPYVE